MHSSQKKNTTYNFGNNEVMDKHGSEQYSWFVLIASAAATLFLSLICLTAEIKVWFLERQESFYDPFRLHTSLHLTVHFEQLKKMCVHKIQEVSQK